MDVAAGQNDADEGASLPGPWSEWTSRCRNLAHKSAYRKYRLQRGWLLHNLGRKLLKILPEMDLADTPAYKYEPLRSVDDRKTIRILMLLPAKVAKDPLQCSLADFAMNIGARNDSFIYDVLSYVWGNVAEKRKLFCFNDRTGEWQVLYITNNLDQALRALRHKHKILCIWVDAVCINQEDVQEKEKQITFMAEIYERSSQCIVWLGIGNARIRKQIQYLRYMPKRLSGLPLMFSILDKSLSLHELDAWIDQNEWFTRAWTFQELLFSRRVEASIGSQTIAFRKLLFQPRPMLAGEDYSSMVSRYNRRLAALSPLSFKLGNLKRSPGVLRPGDRVGYLNLAANIKARSATELKDKVISMTSTLRRLGADSVGFTYDMTLTQLSITASRAWYCLSQALDVMYLAASDGGTAGLPSWSVDWTRNSPGGSSVILSGYIMANRPSAAATKGSYYDGSSGATEDNCKLLLRGLIMDHLTTTHPSWKVLAAISNKANVGEASDQPRRADQPDASQAPLAQHASQVSHSSPSFLTLHADDIESYQHKPLAFGLALGYLASIAVSGADQNTLAKQLLDLLDIQGGDGAVSTIQHVLTAFTAAANAVQSDDQDGLAAFMRLCDTDPPTKRFLDHLSFSLKYESMFRDESMFRTFNNQLGFCLCSTPIEPGDKVALVQGSDYPLILRPTTYEGQSCYTFIGPARITGMMNGELWPDNVDEVEEIVLV